MPYNDLIYVQSGTSESRTQGDAIIPISNVINMKHSGQVERGDTVNYSGYANTMSGRWMPQTLWL